MIGTILFFVYMIWNAICFYFMFMDKMNAKNGKWRKTEKSLITYAMCFGAFGIAFGMIAFHHKISKTNFSRLVGLGIFVNIIAFFVVIKLLL